MSRVSRSTPQRGLPHHKSPALDALFSPLSAGLRDVSALRALHASSSSSDVCDPKKTREAPVQVLNASGSL